MREDDLDDGSFEPHDSASEFERILSRPRPIEPPMWIPSLSELRTFRVNDSSAAHKAKVDEVEKDLIADGWLCNRETPICAARRVDGAICGFRADLIVRHMELLEEDGRPVVGAIEVKPRISKPGELSAALKQASDYVNCWTVATRELVRWSAIYPFGPFEQNSLFTEDFFWGSAHAFGTQMKTFLLTRGQRRFERWDWFNRRLSIRHTPHNAVWWGRDPEGKRLNENRGFAKNATEILCGRRQVGGVRK